jgi:hypothetical protein
MRVEGFDADELVDAGLRTAARMGTSPTSTASEC